MADSLMQPGTRPANTLTRADKRAVGIFAGTAFAVMAFPVALATYAHSRPASEAECITTTNILIDGRWADVTTCRIVGVTVTRTVTPISSWEGR